MNQPGLIVKGGNVFTGGGFHITDILVEKEKIVGLVEHAGPQLEQNAEVIDARGKWVIPGSIDTHMHLRDPGYTHKEDFETGTKAAALGGVTMAIDMPNLKPVINSPERYEEHIRMAGEKAVIDFNHWCSPPGDLRAIRDVLKLGAVGVKVFMIKDTQRGYPHMPELGIAGDSHLYEIFKACSEFGTVCAVHPQNQELAEHIEREYFLGRGLRGPQDYARCFRFGDGMIIDTACSTCILLARATGVRLYLLHLKSRIGVELIRWAHEKALDVVAEINAQHLFLTWADIERIGPYALAAWTPEEDQQVLWEFIRTSPRDIILAGDHAPHTREEKEKGWANMWEAPGGCPCAQEYLPLLLTAMEEGKITLEKIVQFRSEVPAKRFGFYPRKGVIQVGSDADLVILDLNKPRKKISHHEMRSKCGWSPFAGREVKGIPECTIVRGKVVAKDGEILARPGYGKFIKVNPV